MSETLEERLNSHSNAFDGLLSLIPAKYYYDDESKNQWAKKSKKQAKLEAKKRKLARLDPDVKLTALDQKKKIEEEVVNAEQKHIENGENDGNDSDNLDDQLEGDDGEQDEQDDRSDQDSDEDMAVDDTVIFDDNGNLISSPRDESEPLVPEKQSKPKSAPVKIPAASVESPVEQVKAKSDSNSKPPVKKASAQNITELRERLALKIQEMREKRKAPGTGVKGAPVSREAILEARREKKRKRKQNPSESDDSTSTKFNTTNGNQDTQSDDEGEDEDEDEDEESTILFGGVEFKDGQRATADLKALKEDTKKRGPKDLLGQIKHIQAKKRKIASLDAEKREAIEEKAQWSKAILQAEGKKVNDNEKMLQKSLKRQQKKKKKSEKEWKERIHTVDKNIRKRQAKREENLNARKQMKGVKGKTQKDKMKKKIKSNRAGFEGKRK